MSAPFEPPSQDADEPPLSQRQMLVAYLGLDQPPPLRPSWWADLLWLVPIDVVLVYVTLTSHSHQKLLLLLLLGVTSVIIYLVAVRVRFANLLDRHPELRPPQREPVVRRRRN